MKKQLIKKHQADLEEDEPGYFWGLEHRDLVYKGWKGDGAFSYEYEDEELNGVPEVVLACRQAA